ncbi:type II toxin-antitoxin system prevent-host-death family antitoxin [Demequina silvatica]|uniref:type II toxin-antitoxin system prevent-host-death family antitoxin n=1 Tax=Demequina silvatica TaxID=1638988 RepID=UPI000783661D|nr:type II toxin-antitoxin system prevent-host-death family antitoxin [Demequina silvatica]
MTPIDARDFRRDPSAALRAADVAGPVVITDRGRPAYVLSRYEHFVARGRSLARQLTADDDIEFAPDRTMRVERGRAS